MNFARDVVDAAPAAAEALITIGRTGERRSWSFGEISDGAARLAGTLHAHGVRRGGVVMTLVGNRVEWVLAMLACFRSGAVALPCTEMLRAKDLALRLATTQPAAIVADERDLSELEAAGPTCPVLMVDDPALLAADPVPAVELDADDPAVVIFTSGTSGEPKAVLHGQRYLFGQALQAEHWLDARPGELVWCTAAAGWSKSARNTFIAPWLRGARALLHDARFDPAERLDIVEREGVDVLCMAPTEYRVIARRASLRSVGLRTAVAAGEALNAEIVGTWLDGAGVLVRDGYLWFRGRADDVIVSAGYRIGPTEVEGALASHAAVLDAAVVGAPDAERGEVVRAVVVLRDGWAAGPEVAGALQDHVKRETAPYKYPRIVDFAPELPRTASGKLRRAALREPLA
jgi:acetyl-CoA synthetase